MKKTYFVFFAIALMLILTGCPSQIVQAPNFIQGGGTSANSSAVTVSSWGAVQNVTASNGLKGKVDLSWTAVKGAVRYNIYEADTAYNSSYTKRAETTDTSYSISDCGAGSDKYYIVKAVKKSGVESPASLKVHGTSLAEPFVNYVDTGDESYSQNVVYWAMDNVSAYQSDVRYTVYCYDSETGGNLIQSIDVDGSVTDVTSVTFSDLKQNTTYWYYVEAYNVNDPENKVNSGLRVDAETTRKTTPNAVENLTASQGTSLTQISLTFTLPEPCDVLVGSATYETYPLYFKIYRQTLALVDGAWIESTDYTLISKFEGEGDDGFYTQYTPLNADEPYEVGQSITWVDPTTSLSKDYHYQYKVESYADYDKKTIQGKDVVYATGYLASVPDFAVNISNSVINADDSSKYSQIDVTCSVTNIAEGYTGDDAAAKFYLGTMYKSIDGSTTSYSYEEISFTTTSFSKTYSYTDLANQGGYYKYQLFVYSSATVITDDTAFDAVPTDNLLGSVVAAGQILVYENIARPDSSSFAVTCGYSDKIVLEWTASDGINYKVGYTASVTSSEVTIYDSTATEMESGVTGSNGSITYEISGCNGSFTLYAIDPDSSVTDSNTIAAYTLGTPVVTMAANDYTSVKVKYAPVVGATSYDISYTSPVDNTSVDIGVPEHVYTEGAYNYTITDIAGYNNPLISGKDFNVYVTTSCDVIKKSGQGGATVTSLGVLESTVGTLSANILGPANTNVTASIATSENTITVKFDEVDGATKYFLFRERLDMSGAEPTYENVTYTTDDSGKKSYTSDFDISLGLDGYVIDTSSTTPTIKCVDGSSTIDACVSVSTSDGKIIVKETTAAEKDNPALWMKNQDRMSWGYPFRYLAFPIVSASDVYDPATHKIVNYDNASTVCEYDYSKNPDSLMARGCVVGYGTDVVASKSADPRKVTITFTRPYGDVYGTTANPVLYRRTWNTSNSGTYSEGSSGTAGETSFTVTLSGTERTSAFEYAVNYSKKDLYASYISALQNNLMNSSEDDSKYAAYTDEDGTTTYEPFNKGYAFAIDMEAKNIAATDGNEGYNEQVSFTHWDYSKRAIGPDSTSEYAIQIKNLNCSSSYATYGAYAGDWFTVAQIDQSGTLTKANCGYTTPNDGVNPDSGINVWATRCFITNTSNSVTLKPTFGSNWWNTTTDPSSLTMTTTSTGWTIYNSNSANTTSTKEYPVHYGLLRVLRDYKHYYRVHISRAVDNDNEIYASYADNDDATYSSFMDYANSDGAIYAYRKITPQELCQSVNLIIADSLFNTAIPKAGTQGWKNTQMAGASTALTNNSAGSFLIYHYGGDNIFYANANKAKYESSNYQHIYWLGVGPASYSTSSASGSTDSNMIGVTTNQDARTVVYPSDTSYKMNAPWSLDIASKEGGRAYDLTLYGLETTTINVKHEKALASYQGSISLTVGRQDGYSDDADDLLIIYYTPSLNVTDTSSMTLIYNEPAASETSRGSRVSDDCAFLKWFPYKLGVKHETATAVYDTTLQTFQYAWWSGNSGTDGEISSQQW